MEFDPEKVERTTCYLCGGAEALELHHVSSADYDALLGLYRMTCELLQIEQSYADNPPKS